MALVTMLPYELLSRILEIAHFERDAVFDSAPTEAEKKAHLPTVVSRVNRHFRHVALTTATLWSEIHIKCGMGKYRDAKTLSLTKVWLERAKDCPLDLDISDMSLTSGSDAITPIINVFLPCSRWRNFCLETFSLTAGWAAIRLCDGPAPILQSYKIRGIHYYDMAPQEAAVNFNLFQGNAPNLVNVRLESLCMLPCCLSIMSGLKHLEMRELDDIWPSLRQLMDVLRSSPELESLKVSGSPGPLPGPPWTAAHMSMDHLLHIELSDRVIDDMVSFLTVLDMPSLRSFAIGQIRVEDDEAHVEILSRYLCSQRYPLLTHLYIGHVHCTDVWFERLLTRLPTIEELEVNYRQGLSTQTESLCIHTLIRSDIEAGRVGRHTPSLLPNLRCVKLSGFLRRTIFDFLSYRQSLGGTLTHVFIDASDARSFFDTDLEDLRALFIFQFYVHKDWTHN